MIKDERLSTSSSCNLLRCKCKAKVSKLYLCAKTRQDLYAPEIGAYDISNLLPKFKILKSRRNFHLAPAGYLAVPKLISSNGLNSPLLPVYLLEQTGKYSH
jgi:hypothetical protein